MSICDFGINCKVKPGKIVVQVDEKHPLVLLSGFLPWACMFNLIFEDLKKTKKGQWRRGRKLKVRIHLAAYILQQLYNLTDRQTEYSIKDNAAYQVFCGRLFMDKWHVPDHTKIEKFRSRITPETQRQLANMIAVSAAKSGIADPGDLDLDSTVQEANMTYPTDAKMLRKLSMITAKVANAIKSLWPDSSYDLMVNLKEISLKAKNCFFQKRYASTEEKSDNLRELFNAVKKPVNTVIAACEQLTDEQVNQLKWNVKLAKDQLVQHGKAYLKSAKEFIETGKATKGKKLSFHLDQVECFNKGKEHKKHEFGRAFQLGKIGGNFVFVGECTSVRMDDKQSFEPMLKEHELLFGKDSLSSIGTDKGYYKKSNVKYASKKGIEKIGIQQPSTVTTKQVEISEEDEEELYNRRSGIEPIIGHIKQGGQLGRSRMKKDETIKASGYASVFGFNLRQVIKANTKKWQDQAA